MKSEEIENVKKNYNLDVNIKKYGDAIDIVGLWESEKTIFKKYISLSDKILDIGCGAGRTTINLYKEGYKDIIGLDLSDKLIEYGKKYCEQNNLNVNLVVGNALSLEYKDNLFDVVIFSYNGMMCIPGTKNRIKVLEEIYRVLKPGGLYIFTAHNRDDSGKYTKSWEDEKLLWERGLQDPRNEIYGDRYVTDRTGETIYLHFSNIEEVKTLVESVGFEVAKHIKNTEVANETEETKEFAGETVFWVVRK